MTPSQRRKMIAVTIGPLALSLWLGAALASEWPKVSGAAFAFRNANPATPLVAFDAKGRDLLAFNCVTRGRALLGRFYDLVCDGGSFHAKDAGTWIGLQVAKSGAFTIEVTFTAAEAAPKARGVVLAYGDERAEDVALLQEKSGLALRLGGLHATDLFVPEAGKSVHVVIACDKETWVVYRDGKSVRSGARAAGAPAWGTRQLVMGAAWSGADAWRGRLEGVAVFPRALNAEEAAGEAVALRAFQAERKPARTVRFRGTLLRQARTADLGEIRPYTRSLTVAKYKVAKVLSGEWKEPTIAVLHWMIMDSKRLPIADRKPGIEVELSVEPLEEHPQLESCRRDEIDNEIEADLFYCECEANS